MWPAVAIVSGIYRTACVMVLMSYTVRALLAESTYPTDALTVLTCNTNELVLAWDVKQDVYEISLDYSCINPSGVLVSKPYN